DPTTLMPRAAVVARSVGIAAALGAVCIVLCGLATLYAVPADPAPARYQAGAVPPIQVQALGAGEVFLDATVDARGAVGPIVVLRATPPFTQPLVDAVRSWVFTPAERDQPVPGSSSEVTRGAVDSHVLVAGVFRAPTYNVPTLGDAPKDVAVASDA